MDLNDKKIYKELNHFSIQIFHIIYSYNFFKLLFLPLLK
jgi:hypothetical protein